MLPAESDGVNSRLTSQETSSEKTHLHSDERPPSYSSSNMTNANSSSTSSSTHYTYQELPGSAICPTCNGSGRIPRGQEDLVALIPYTDDRLKPRRTKLYVFLSILLCGVVAGVMCAFLLTKPVRMSIQSITTNKIELNATIPKMILDLEITYNISNSNFPAIYLKNMTVIGTQSFNSQPVVSNTSVVDAKVWGRSHAEFSVNVTAIFTDPFVPEFCSAPHTSKLVMVELVSSLQYQLMTQSSSVISSEYVRVICAKSEMPNMG